MTENDKKAVLEALVIILSGFLIVCIYILFSLIANNQKTIECIFDDFQTSYCKVLKESIKNSYVKETIIKRKIEE